MSVCKQKELLFIGTCGKKLASLRAEEQGEG